jgi:hypothetical protein
MLVDWVIAAQKLRTPESQIPETRNMKPPTCFLKQVYSPDPLSCNPDNWKQLNGYIFPWNLYLVTCNKKRKPVIRWTGTRQLANRYPETSNPATNPGSNKPVINTHIK